MEVILWLQDQISYLLVGSDSAKQVFYVNPNTGLISLKKSLTETVDQQFTVSFSRRRFDLLWLRICSTDKWRI